MDEIPIGIDDMPEQAFAPLDPMSAEWDIVENLRTMLQDVPQMVLKHVKGHQDRTIQYPRDSDFYPN